MRKRLFLISMIMMTVLLAGCAANPSESRMVEEAETEEEVTLAVDEPLMQAEIPERTVVSSYSVLRRAGASQPLFLEEDISQLITMAAEERASQINAAPLEAQLPEEATEEATQEAAEEVTEEVKEEDAEETEGEEEKTPEEEPAAPPSPQPATGGGRVVCIDAGHQGHQNSEKEPIGPGAAETKMKVTSGTSGVATGVPEHKLTLAVALKLQNVLQQRGYSVIMCRTSADVNISNAERASIANNAGASAFIRIHADGAQSPSAAGGSTLAPSGSNPYCAAIASSSQKLAKCVINSYCAKTGMKNRGVQITDSMTGLNWSQVPVTIIEMGFMTNPAEDQLMQTESFQQSAAEGIADGIDAFMQ